MQSAHEEVVASPELAAARAGLARRAYEVVFRRQWPAWLGGLLIGITSIALFAWSRPWGVIAGPREWVDWTFYGAGIYSTHPRFNPLLSSGSILTMGLIGGAFGSALLSRQFALKIPSPFELARSVAGGAFMGTGAALAAGCNVGGFFSATSALSLSGPAMMAGLLAGCFIEAQFYYSWELTRFRYKRGEGRPRQGRIAQAGGKDAQPWAGCVMFGAFLVAASAYFLRGTDAVSGYSYVTAGGLLLGALVLGVVLHRSRFAFLQAFREPFVSGRADMARGMVIAVSVSVAGFALIKAGGLRPEADYVMPTFWIGSFLGGALFGFGMPLAGGCASGCCWRVAEGSIKVGAALAVMAVANSLMQAGIEASSALQWLRGSSVYLPSFLSYYGSVALILAIMALYWIVMSWNQKTGKFL